MKRMIRGLAALALIAAAIAWLGTSADVFALARGRAGNFAGAPDLENGKTLFSAGGCASCHATPNQDDRTKLGGGLALRSPFGVFHIPNISPHQRDGLGAWTVENFARAMREGVSPDGRHYYPAFPYTSYQRMSDADLRDLFAFIKTTPQAEGRARDHELLFPFSIRRALGAWKWLYLDGKAFAANAQDSAQINRGGYLVEGPGHCAECHSPRNFLGGIIRGMRFAGGPDPEGKEGSVPNITPHETGLKDYSAQDIAGILATGLKPDGDSVGGSMGNVSKNFANVPKSDVDAVAAYVKSLPPVQAWKK